MTSSVGCSVACYVTLLLATFGGYFCEDNRQKLSVEPSDAVMSQGQLVILQCTVQNQVGVVQWIRDGFGLGVGPTFDGFPRYRIDQNHATGVHNLVISNVQLEDDATFQCQVGATDTTPGLRSRVARLTVNVPPIAVTIDSGPTIDVVSGTSTDLICRATGGRPAANIAWRKSGVGSAAETAVTENVATPGETKRFDAISRLTIRATLEDQGASFRCSANNSAMQSPMTADVQLNVLYAPIVSMSSSPAADKSLREFDRVVFTCSAQSNPQPSVWRWFKGDEAILGGEKANVLTIDRIDRSFHGKYVTCEAINDVDSAKQSTIINLYYGPVFINEAVEQTADEGANEVTMSCEVDSNPAAVYIWSRDEARFPVLSRGPTLTISPVTKDSFGPYRCVATVDGFQPISRVVSLLRNGQSEIRSDGQQWARFGDTATVECEVRAIPEPKHITWTKNGKPIDFSLNNRYKIEEREARHGRVSLLVISNVQDSDFGVYNCTTDNGYGPTHLAVTLSQQAVVPLPYILAAVLSGLLIVVIICIVFYVYRRRKLSGSEIGSDSSECRITRTNSKKEAVPDLRIEYTTSGEYPQPIKYDTTDTYIDAWKSDGGYDGQQYYSGTQSLRENYNPYDSWNRRSPQYRHHPASIQTDYVPSHETFNYQYARPESKADYRGESVYGPEIYGTLRSARAAPTSRVMSPIRRDVVSPYDFRSTMTSPSPLAPEYSQLATNV